MYDLTFPGVHNKAGRWSGSEAALFDLSSPYGLVTISFSLQNV